MLPRSAGFLALALGAAACAAQAAPRARAAVPRAARPLSADARRQVDRRYYEAVDSYMKADYAGARELIRDIFSADPGNADAAALLVRIKAAEKAGAPPP